MAHGTDDEVLLSANLNHPNRTGRPWTPWRGVYGRTARLCRAGLLEITGRLPETPWFTYKITEKGRERLARSPLNRKQPPKVRRTLAQRAAEDMLRALRAVDAWFEKANGPAGDHFLNGERDMCPPGKDGWDLGEAVHSKVRAAIAKAEGKA